MSCLALAACTQIGPVNVNTVAVGCVEVERGEARDAGGDAAASVLQQAGEAGARFAGSLRSIIRCPHGMEVWTDAQGEIPPGEPQ